MQPVYLTDLQQRLLALVRQRIQNGELTERGLARLAGVSQPHVHNVLKGVRFLSPEMSDSLLKALRLSALDLVPDDEISTHLARDPRQPVYVPLWEGTLGPGFPLPLASGAQYYRTLPPAGAGGAGLAAVRVAFDSLMGDLFRGGQIVLTDTASLWTGVPEPGGYYAVRCGLEGRVRRLQKTGEELIFGTEQDSDNVLAVPMRCMRQVVCARVLL